MFVYVHACACECPGPCKIFAGKMSPEWKGFKMPCSKQSGPLPFSTTTLPWNMVLQQNLSFNGQVACDIHLWLLLFYILICFVGRGWYPYAAACTSVRVSLPESVLSFHHVGSEDPIQAGKCLHLLSHLASASPWVFKAGIVSFLLLILQHPLLFLAFAKCSRVNKTSR